MHGLHRLNEAIRSLARPTYEFPKRHEDRWEILMAILAVAFVSSRSRSAVELVGTGSLDKLASAEAYEQTRAGILRSLEG